jgi:hypothetical protein
MNQIKKIYKKYNNDNNNNNDKNDNNDNNDNKILLELIINLYLIQCKYRNLFQIIFHKNDKLDDINNILEITNSKFIMHAIDNTSDIRLIVYNDKLFDINKLDKTYGKKFAQQLGKFYVCATNDSKRAYKYQIQLIVTQYNIPLYSQMCKKNIISKNINLLLKMSNDIKKILFNLDKNITTSIKINVSN